MAKFVVIHRVEDFDSWKPKFDEDKTRRDQAGLTEVGVFRQDNDPNNVAVIFEGNNVDEFQKMASDPELAEKMKDAGVISKPEFIIG